MSKKIAALVTDEETTIAKVLYTFTAHLRVVLQQDSGQPDT